MYGGVYPRRVWCIHFCSTNWPPRGPMRSGGRRRGIGWGRPSGRRRPAPAGAAAAAGRAGGAALAARVRVPARRGRPAAGHGGRTTGPRRPECWVRRPADFQAREPGRTTYLDGVRAAAPIGVAALAFGVSFGVLARAADMGQVAPGVMSVTTFAGSAQFA